MSKYVVLQLGDETQFEQDPSNIEKLINSGYKVVKEVDARSAGEARYKHHGTENDNDGLNNPSGYLKVANQVEKLLRSRTRVRADVLSIAPSFITTTRPRLCLVR